MANTTAASQDNASASAAKSGSGHRWTFLTNHSHVLVLLHADPDMVLREVASMVGITERAVQRIIQDLEAGGYIERERVGRRNRYRVMTDQALRHPIESHRQIGDLLQLIAREDE
ncbi:MAG: winged helix-turn-helix transcriptional regulator [Fuerstiella sp.]